MTLRSDLEALIKKQEPATARAFQVAIIDLTDRTVIKRLTDALRRGDVEGAIRALNIEAAVFRQMQASVVATYSGAGSLVTAATVWRLPDYSRAVVRWDMANPVAETWVRNKSSQLITRITEQTKDGVRAAIGGGYARGQGPQSIALDIVGRIGASGRRTGGLLGLTMPQAGHVESMRRRLSSGDVSDLRDVLRMTKRDRRFDATIKKAIRTGKPLTASQVSKLTARYSDRLLKLRGDTIARTETASAVEAGRLDSFRQGMAKADIPPQAVFREWLHGGPAPTQARADHEIMHRRRVIGTETPWILPDGTMMMHPLDTSMGAGANHIVNCRCMQNIRIDYGYLKRNG